MNDYMAWLIRILCWWSAIKMWYVYHSVYTKSLCINWAPDRVFSNFQRYSFVHHTTRNIKHELNLSVYCFRKVLRFHPHTSRLHHRHHSGNHTITPMPVNQLRIVKTNALAIRHIYVLQDCGLVMPDGDMQRGHYCLM